MVLSQIFVYPIKSVRGIAVDETLLDVSGPVQDRRWMLVDSQGLFLSQRKLPRMALISPSFDGTNLVVTAPGMVPLVISEWAGEGETMTVTIWRDKLTLPHPNQLYSDWFSRFLGRPCRLVHLPDTVARPIEPPFQESPWRVSLADGFPLLVLAQASLDLLNHKLPSPVGVERFSRIWLCRERLRTRRIAGVTCRSDPFASPSSSPVPAVPSYSSTRRRR